MSTLLGKPVQSNAIQYKCSAIKSIFMMPVRSSFVENAINVNSVICFSTDVIVIYVFTSVTNILLPS